MRSVNGMAMLDNIGCLILTSEVKKHPILYDFQFRDYNNYNVKEK